MSVLLQAITDGVVEQPESPEVEKVSGGYNVTRIFLANKSSLKTFLDGLNIGDADSEYTSAKLRTVNTSMESPSVKKVSLVYQDDNTVEQPWPSGGTVTQSASAAPLEVPLPEAPNSPGAAEQEFCRRDGVEAVLVPAPEYTYSIIANSFAWSEENVIGNVAKIVNAPTGLTAPTPGKWLQMDRKVETNGDKVRISDSYRYNPTGWKTELYETV